MKLYCAWSSFLQNWDRRIINKKCLNACTSYVLSLICEAVLCLELVFAELGQAHYK